MKTSLAASLIAVLAIASATPSPAADHGDSPALASDLGADIGDAFFFLDPTDITKTVLIATIHGFLVPGVMPNFAAFDSRVRFRFELYNDHVNLPHPDPELDLAQKASFLKHIRANRIIDVTFAPQQVGNAPQAGSGGFIPANLRRPLPQDATVTFTGFPNFSQKVYLTDATGNALQVTPLNTSSTAPAFVVQSLNVAPSKTIQFFAGVVDDPSFADLPALNSFVDGTRNGGAPNVAAFSRARDTFAGYNTLAIALRVPTELLRGEGGRFVAMDFLTQRQSIQQRTKKGVRASGGFKTVDRIGNPFINELLIPFDQRDSYNASRPRDDVAGKFKTEIKETLQELGLSPDPADDTYRTFANRYFGYGDLLKLDTDLSNLGSPAGAGYPNGRRLQDDAVDSFLTMLNQDSTVSDGVANSGSLTTSFPFLGKPNQPLPAGSGTDDATRN